MRSSRPPIRDGPAALIQNLQYPHIEYLMAANAGLGYLLRDASETWDSPKLFVTVISLAALGLVSFSLIRRLEKKMAPWRQSAEW